VSNDESGQNDQHKYSLKYPDAPYVGEPWMTWTTDKLSKNNFGELVWFDSAKDNDYLYIR
jgi:hypothetical protein